jgi:membrane protein required for beta-lactamase induction
MLFVLQLCAVYIRVQRTSAMLTLLCCAYSLNAVILLGLQAFDATAAAATLRADCIAVRVPYSSPAPGSIAAQEAAATADAADSEDSDASKQVTRQLLAVVLIASDCSCRSYSSGVHRYDQ